MASAPRIPQQYLEAAMEFAQVEDLGDGYFVGSIPGCPGLLGYGRSAGEANDDLRIALLEWSVIGLKLGAELPVFGGIDLNVGQRLEPVGSL